MKGTKKLTSIVLVICLLLTSFFTGCGQKKAEPTNTDNGAKKETSESSTKKETKKDTPKASKIVVYNNSGVMGGAESASDATIINDIKSWMKDGTGVEVEVIAPPAGQEAQKLNMLLAGGSQLDVFWGDWPNYASKKVILPINELLEKYGQDAKKAWGEKPLEGMTDKDGKTWGIPRMTPFLGNPLWVRQDWLKELGMDVPKNIEEYEKVLEAFKNQKPGGESTIPLLADISGKHASKGLHGTFLGAFTEYGNSNWQDKDGKIKPMELQAGFKDFVVTMNRWYEKGYMFPEFASLSKDKIRELIKQNKVGSAAVWYSNITLTDYPLHKNFPDADYVYPQGGLVGNKGLAETSLAASTNGALISARCEDPEAAMKVLNFLYEDPANHMVSWFGPENKFWQWKDKENYIYETIGEKKGYFSDYCFSIGLPMEVAVKGDNQEQARHQAYLAAEGTDYSRAKMPFDSGVVYDVQTINQRVPSNADIERMREEEVIKFIMGSRDISEWDQFIEDLYNIGLQDWIDVHTEMYNAQK